MILHKLGSGIITIADDKVKYFNRLGQRIMKESINNIEGQALEDK